MGTVFFMFFLFPPKTKMDCVCSLSSLRLEFHQPMAWKSSTLVNMTPMLPGVFFRCKKNTSITRWVYSIFPRSFCWLRNAGVQRTVVCHQELPGNPPMGACMTGIQVGRSFTRISSVIWRDADEVFVNTIAGKYKHSVVERTHGLHETKQLFPFPVNKVMFYRIHWYNGIMVLWYTSGTVNDRCVVFCRNSIMSTVGTRVMSLMLLGLHYIHRFTFPWAICSGKKMLEYMYINITKRTKQTLYRGCHLTCHITITIMRRRRISNEKHMIIFDDKRIIFHQPGFVCTWSAVETSQKQYKRIHNNIKQMHTHTNILKFDKW